MNADATKRYIKSYSTFIIPSNATDDSDNNLKKNDNVTSSRDDDVIELNQVNLTKATGYITVNIKGSYSIKKKKPVSKVNDDKIK